MNPFSWKNRIKKRVKGLRDKFSKKKEELLKLIKDRVDRERLLFPKIRLREVVPLADLSVINHVFIGRTNVISYPYSSEVCRAYIGKEQYKFYPDKIASKY